LERLPEDAIWANPRLGLTRVWLLLDVYQPQQALAYLERYSAAVEREAAGSIQAEALSLQAVCLAMQRRPEQALALAQQAEQAGLGSDPFVQAHVLFSLAAAYKMGHQNALAEHAFRQAAAVAAANDNPYLAFSCFGNLGDIYFNSARLREAEVANRRALEFAALASGGEQPYAGWLHWSQARIYYEWNDLPGAQREAELCLAQCRRWGNQAMAVRALLVLAQAAQARHEPDAARAHLDEADELARQVEDERLLAGVIRQRVALAVATRDLDLARRWEATLPAGADQASVNHCLARARLSLAEGRPRAALEHLERALAALAPTDLVTLRVQVLALEAVARRAHGQPEAALAALEQALALAGPGGFVRTFLDEAAPMRELLRRAAARSPGPADSQRLLAAFAQATAPPADALALTVRERQILRLMAAGLSNRDMAEELVIAEATLKRHVSNLYGKLEAHSRTQALARAASLKLL
jgi:LuxR family maltose regulon positive regulatory protein